LGGEGTSASAALAEEPLEVPDGLPAEVVGAGLAPAPGRRPDRVGDGVGDWWAGDRVIRGAWDPIRWEVVQVRCSEKRS